ncbi:MAG: hypothetical protein MZW92_67860 [Comamonadaceae bacterium]|nr:hypothetical protein [Comamonadaceae bacterium]
MPEHGDGAEIDAPPASAAGTPAANDRLRFLLSAAPVMLYARRPAADFALTYLSDNVAAHFGYPAQRFVEDEGFGRRACTGRPCPGAAEPRSIGRARAMA